MIGLLLTLIIGLGIALISWIYMPGVITISPGDNQYYNIPLYAIPLFTYSLGIFLAWIIEIPQSVGTAFHIMGLGRTVRSGNNTISELQNKIIKLEAENAQLRDHNRNINTNRQPIENYQPNVIQNFLHRLDPRSR